MISNHNSASLIGVDVTDADGDKIGTVGQIFVDPATGTPTWADGQEWAVRYVSLLRPGWSAQTR